MNKEIIITKHALEEYIKDNPLKKNPKRHLECLFATMLLKTKTREATFRRFDDKNASIMKYKWQVIIYNNYVIITYYRLYSQETREYRALQKSKISLLIKNERVYKKQHKKKKKHYRLLKSITRPLFYKW